MHNDRKQPCCTKCNWQEMGMHQFELWGGALLPMPRTIQEADDRALLSESTGAVRLAISEAVCLALQSTCYSVSKGVQVHAQGSQARRLTGPPYLLM